MHFGDEKYGAPHRAAWTETRRVLIADGVALVNVSTRDSGVLLTVRVLVEARGRRSVDDQFWRATLEAFEAEPNVELAYPTTRAYLREPLIVYTDSS